MTSDEEIAHHADNAASAAAVVRRHLPEASSKNTEVSAPMQGIPRRILQLQAPPPPPPIKVLTEDALSEHDRSLYAAISAYDSALACSAEPIGKLFFTFYFLPSFSLSPHLPT